MVGGASNDSLNGGPGIDTVSFAGRPRVTVNLVNRRATGDGTDSLSALEIVIGSSFDDVITAAAAGSRLEGGEGSDTLNGKAGQDYLLGGLGNDAV